MLCKSMDWFLFDDGLRHERVNHSSPYIMTFLLLVDPLENSIRITINSVYCGTFGIDFYLFVLCRIWKTYLRKISSVLMSPTPFRCIIFAELLLMFGEGFQKIQRRFARGVVKKNTCFCHQFVVDNYEKFFY